jgi:single-strand DNA-binding protein
LNKVILTNAFVGKKGIELKFTPGSGKAVSTYSVAVPKEFSKEKEYDYINCVTWGTQGEWLANNQDRIKKVGISGRIQTRSYDAKDGTKRYVTEVITDHVEVEEWKNEGQTGNKQNNEGLEGLAEDKDGDIPF